MDWMIEPSASKSNGYATNMMSSNSTINAGSNLDDEAASDEEDRTRRHREKLKRNCAFLLNGDARTEYDQSLLRSMSLNYALDESSELCEVCNIRQKMGRMRRRRTPRVERHKLQRHEVMSIFYLGLIDFIGFCSMSVMAPFFPKEAKKKGMDTAESGYVFSFYAFVMFVTAPFFGKILPQVGIKFMFIAGVFLTGGCNILFGMLPQIQDNTTFAIYCFVVRGFEALGACAFSTASFIYVIHLFPDNISSVLGIMETFAGLGMSIGPAFGGFAYAAGGFALPFYVLGSLMILLLPIYMYMLPDMNTGKPVKHPGVFFSLLKVPSILVIFLVVVISSNAWSFLDPTLEPHLSELNLTSQETGFVFLIFSAVYGVSSPIWGYVGDKVNNHWSMMAIGMLGTATSLVLLGPSPILNLESTLLLNIGALCLLGLSVALSLAPTFKALLECSFNRGHSDSISTYSIIAGIWSCGYSLGDMTGPTLGGVLLEYFSYEICTTTMAILALSMALICVFYFGIIDNPTYYNERHVIRPILLKDKIAYYGALSSGSDAVNITLTNAGACEV